MSRTDVMACVAMVGFLWACASGQVKPECSDAMLAEIDARYTAELILACNGQHLDDCEAFPAIRDQYDALREEWVQCR
jgi:hypothetical protein